MEGPDLQLKNTDIATGVAYYGVTELLDFIGVTRIEEYLLALAEDESDTRDRTGVRTKMHVHKQLGTAKIQLGDKCRMTIGVGFTDNDPDGVVVDLQLDGALALLLRRRTSDAV